MSERITDRPFGWCFIGTGTLAGGVAREITASGRHRIVSVCSRRVEKAREFAAAWGGKAFATAEEALAQPGVDGVYIVTPHNHHGAYVRLAVEKGIPVLCEKPFAVTEAEARPLLEAAAQKGVYVTEAMWTWFAPVARQALAWVRDGALGNILSIQVNYHLNVRSYAPRLTDPNLAGGALLDSGVYPLTYVYRLFGMPSSLTCTGVIEGGVDLTDEIDLTFPNGMTAHISLSICDGDGGEVVRIAGDRALLTVDAFHCAREGRLQDAADPGREQVVTGATTMLNEFDLVAEEIREGLTESRYVPHRATLDVQRLMDECRKQIGLVYPFEK